MASTRKLLKTFSGGVITPELFTRLDLTKHQTGLEEAINFWITTFGAVQNRPGFKFIIPFKQKAYTRLIDFDFGEGQTYVLEFGDKYVRFHTNGGTLLDIPNAKIITNITQANPAVVTTSTAHDLAVGDWVFIDLVVGMTEVNQRYFRVKAVPTTTTLELQRVPQEDNEDSTGYTAYTSGGALAPVFELTSQYAQADLDKLKYTQSADVLTITRQGYDVTELRRNSTYDWEFKTVSFIPSTTTPVPAPTLVENDTGGTPVDESYAITALAPVSLEESFLGPKNTANLDLDQAGAWVDIYPPAGWVERSTGLSGTNDVTLYGSAFAPTLGSSGRFVLTGEQGSTDALIITSDDGGVTWTERANPKNFQLWGVDWSPSLGLFAAVGNADGTDTYIVTSPDGVTWTERAAPKNIACTFCKWFPRLGMFIATGGFDTVNGYAYLITSTNGTTWTQRVMPSGTSAGTDVNAIDDDGTTLYGVGDHDITPGEVLIVKSTDGITWSKVPDGHGNTGTRETILYSPTYQRWYLGDWQDGAVPTNAYITSTADFVTFDNELLRLTTSGLFEIEMMVELNGRIAALGDSDVSGKAVIFVSSGDGIWKEVENDLTEAIRTAVVGTIGSTPVVVAGGQRTSAGGDPLVATAFDIAREARYRIYKLFNGIWGFIGETDGSKFRDDNFVPDVSRPPPEPYEPFIGPNDKPEAVGYVEGRRAFGGTLNSPSGFWMTRSGTESNLTYTIPTRDDNSISARILSRKINSIRHIVQMTWPVFLTSGGVWEIEPNTGDFLTPSNVYPRLRSQEGASHTRPIEAGHGIVYTHVSGKRIHELQWREETDSLSTIDLSVLVPHLLEGQTVVDAAYSSSDRLAWFVLSNGQLLGLTYLPEHEIVAFHVHLTQGHFFSITVANEGSRDVLYAGVKRKVGGTDFYYLERLEGRDMTGLTDQLYGPLGSVISEAQFFTPPDVENGIFMDSAIEYNGASTSTLSNAHHLAGKTVKVLVDGARHADVTVSSTGGITLSQAGTHIIVGLGITGRVKTLPWSVEDTLNAGGGLGFKQVISKAHLHINTSALASIKAGPAYNKLRPVQVRAGDDWDVDPQELRTEIPEITFTPDVDRAAAIHIEVTDPLPLTITGMTEEVEARG